MLISVKRKTVFGIFFFVLFLGSFFLAFHYFSQRPRVRLGEHVIFCNPKAKIDPEKTYQLKLWDYDWPVNRENGGYGAFLRKAVADFQRGYPNIKVEITLLDLLNGPQQFTQAIKANLAPDVYCSALTIPQFNYQRQIPVGFFMNQTDTDDYYSSLLKLTMRHGIPCYFPRWTAPGIWIGNQALLEKAGFSPAQLQQKGWSLKEFWEATSKVPPSGYLFVGNPGFNGFFPQLAADYTGGVNPILNLRPKNAETSSIHYTLDQFEKLIKQRGIPTDFDSNMLGHFLSGKTMIMAGVRPILFRFLKERAAAAGSIVNPVVLPPPSSIWPKNLVFTENSVIGVYRNKFTAGDDQIMAAVKLGRFLSVYSQVTPNQEMMVIPAAKGIARTWGMKMEGLSADCAVLMDLLENATPVDLEALPEYQEKVYPALRDFLTGKISRESVTARLISENDLIPDSK